MPCRLANLVTAPASIDYLIRMSIYEHNRRAWDERARRGARFAVPASDDELAQPLELLDAAGWLGDVRGQRLLCLGAGGGKHGPLYAAAGAIVTVVDLSGEMLALDRQIATERSLALRTVQASMDDLVGLGAGEFDVVVHPVSTCYVADIAAVYREVARVTAPGARYISQHKQPVSLQADIRATARGYELVEPYYRRGPLPAVAGSMHREEGTLEFLHRLEEIFGGLCRAGFVIEDVIEPLHAKADAEKDTFAHRSVFVPPYIRIKARRTAERAVEKARGPKLWSPEG